MEHRQTNPGDQTNAWLTALIARSLDIPESELDADTHLSRYGLDSLSAIAIMMEVSDTSGIGLNDSALIDYPTISLLAEHISARSGETRDAACPANAHTDIRSLMRQDSLLPDDIQTAPGELAANPTAILLTGATGFLGIHLLEVLAKNTHAQIYCLIRSSIGDEPPERLANAASENRLDIQEWKQRVTVLEGDLCKPYLGLDNSVYDHLASSIDWVYHCAADVNWGLDYISLRHSNVLPTVSLLRFCGVRRKKNMVFVSSISVCYAYQGPDSVDENTPALSLLEDIHLGYAQSKVIAEALCEQAIVRGLAITIHRPALILGNSVTGHSNHDDLVSRLIKGCITMGCAPDLDWLVDACPVNEVAEAIYNLATKKDRLPGVTHLVHPRSRNWRELVLWMNIYGYAIKLVPYSQWTRLLSEKAQSTSHPLYPLRAFFLRQLPEADGLTLPETYEKSRRSNIIAADTHAELDIQSHQYSSLDSDLFERYFEDFTDTKFLPAPAPAHSNDKSSRDIHTVLNEPFFASLAEQLFGRPNPQICVTEQSPTSAVDSIISDLASWKFGKPSGLFHYQLKDDSTHMREAFVKVKPEDKAVLDVAATVADLSSEGLGALISRYQRQTGLANCHKRELAVYRQTDSRFQAHSPQSFLQVDDDENQQWIIAMQAITDPLFMDTAAISPRWSSENIISCIDGLAKLHSIWLGRKDELKNQKNLCNSLTAVDMEQAKPLWFALARHTGKFMETTIGNTLQTIRDELIDSIHGWWEASESLDRTLIHNDFNPRNIAIVNRQGQPALCAFDWELASIGLPQHDLAEFLCFALPPEHDKDEPRRYLELHRKKLAQSSGRSIDRDNWLYGFQLALYDLAVNRIPMYTLIHHIKPQRFLPRVTQTWYALFKEFSNGKYR